MSLPSQSSRNATRSSQVHYRRSTGGPFRKIMVSLLVVAALALVWYFFIRPNAKPASPNTTQGENPSAQQANANQNSTPASNPQPNTDNPSSRPLPGAGDRPDPNKDLDRALGSNAPNNTPGTPTKTATHNPVDNPSLNSSGTTDILGAAVDEAQNQPINTPVAAPPSRTHASANPAGIRLQLDSADRLIAENNSVGARVLLSRTLISGSLSPTESQILRDKLTAINNQLLFSPVVDPKDAMCETYKVQSGDSLSKIASRRELATHWKLIARVNQIADPSKIRYGQNLKLVRGPFHAVVNKAAHRLDIFHGSPGDPSSWLYIRSFDVGLGTSDGTPVGDFVVSENKLENPGWVNPRNAREQYAPNDPKNPIGEYWIGIDGVGQYAPLTSLGLHGTIDPDSIGKDRSMGCVRLADTDIPIVYELLAEHISRVIIKP